jgi:hypothetical protein
MPPLKKSLCNPIPSLGPIHEYGVIFMALHMCIGGVSTTEVYPCLRILDTFTKVGLPACLDHKFVTLQDKYIALFEMFNGPIASVSIEKKPRGFGSTYHSISKCKQEFFNNFYCNNLGRNYT